MLRGGARLTKRKRLDEVFRRLRHTPPASSGADALALLAAAINQVEDEHSGVAYDQLASRTMIPGPRMYPPLPDSRKPTMLRGVERYATVRHKILIAANGAIVIQHVSGAVELSVPGADGKEIDL